MQTVHLCAAADTEERTLFVIDKIFMLGWSNPFSTAGRVIEEKRTEIKHGLPMTKDFSSRLVVVVNAKP